MRRAANRHYREPVVSAPAVTVPGRSGKRCYADKATAAKLAKRTRRDWDGRVPEYRCIKCHFWHIGER